MLTKNLIKAVEKSPTLIGIRHNNGNHTYYNNHNIMEIIDQEGEAINVYIRRKNQHDDIQSDYFAGSFYHSIKSALSAFEQN